MLCIHAVMGVYELVQELPKKEKLQLLNMLLADLDEDEISSPTWHENILKETEEKYIHGDIKSISLSEAEAKLL